MALNCPQCKCRILISCSSCHSSLEVQQHVQDGLTYFNISKELSDRKQLLEKHRALAEAADKRRGFLKLQVPLEPSTDSDLLSGEVTIFVRGSDEIRAHRFILADKSPVFRRMFGSDMIESKTGVISIDDASYQAVRTLVQFCYTAKIDFTEVRAEEVLSIAHKYQIFHLRDLSAEELCGKIAKENLIEMITLARDYEAKQLQEALADYLLKNFYNLFPILLQPFEFVSCGLSRSLDEIESTSRSGSRSENRS